jgi:Tfp pilus assembly protein PilX
MKTRQRRPRRGLALIPALVCLVLVGMLCALALRSAHTQRMATATEQRRLQAEWLAESGAARASARLAADADYKGETWDVAATALGGETHGAGVVRIKVEPVEGGRGRRRIHVEADYPRHDPAIRARHSKSLILDVSKD